MSLNVCAFTMFSFIKKVSHTEWSFSVQLIFNDQLLLFGDDLNANLCNEFINYNIRQAK